MTCSDYCEKSYTVLQIKYLNNIVDRFIKKLIKPMLGFKSFHSAKITITGIENIRMIQKRQIIKIMFLLLRILLC